MKDIRRQLAIQQIKASAAQERPDPISAQLMVMEERLDGLNLSFVPKVEATADGWRAGLLCIDQKDVACFCYLLIQDHCRSKAIAEIIASYAKRNLEINQASQPMRTSPNNLAPNFN